MTSAPATSPTVVEESAATRVAQLTPGQFQCVQLVSRHFSSKEIALALGISRHTVDQRIRIALHVLGVERRSEAARLLEHVCDERLNWNAGSAVPAPRDARRLRRPSMPPSWSSLQWPVATKDRPRNEMSGFMRLLWIVAIAMGAAVSTGMYLAGLESLARMLQG